MKLRACSCGLVGSCRRFWFPKRRGPPPPVLFGGEPALTRGRDGTEVLLYAIYLEGFQYFKMGYAAALTVLFLLIILAFSLLQAFRFDRKVHY